MPDADGKKPQAKHLQTRAEYLLKVLRKQAEFTAAPVSAVFTIHTSVNAFDSFLLHLALPDSYSQSMQRNCQFLTLRKASLSLRFQSIAPSGLVGVGVSA